MSLYPSHGGGAWSLAEWQKRREKFGGWDEYGRDTRDPFESFSATQIAKYVRKYFLPDLAVMNWENFV